MKFSYQWLSDLVDGLGANDPVDVMRLITMKTAECEGIEEAGALMRGACAARGIAGRICGRFTFHWARKLSRAWRATACWQAVRS
jgi:hypothetical protein